jgi:hypothetical protein
MIHMAPNDLNRKLDDQPFKPFRIRLVNNTTYDIMDPAMIIVGDTSAVVATRNIRDDKGHRVTTDWRTVSIQHMLKFSDIAQHANGGGGKGRNKR